MRRASAIVWLTICSRRSMISRASCRSRGIATRIWSISPSNSSASTIERLLIGIFLA